MGTSEAIFPSAQRKARGAYFTPAAVCTYLARWAIRSSFDRTFEPSCGDANFLIAAAEQLQRLKAQESVQYLFDPLNYTSQLVGVEVDPTSAKTASSHLAAAAARSEIIRRDFFDVQASADFDVVLGNPPFIRYQSFAGSARQKALRAALAAGVNLSGLASSWAPFLIHATKFLKPSGRLGMVLPAELLSVSYAAPVRRFLLQRFASLKMVVFERLIFEDALEDVVLLMAEGSGGCDKIEVVQVPDAEGLPPPTATMSVAAKNLKNDRWTATLVKADAWEAFIKVGDGPLCERLADWGTTYLGTVTGENKFFCLSDAQVAAAGLSEADLLRVSPPGSRHLRGLEFGSRSWSQLRTEGRRCWLFYPAKEKLGPAAAAYVADGERTGIHKGYKCSVRTPWWRVPLVPKADLFLTYMDYERPRLVTNSAGTHHLNSLYGLALKKRRKSIGCQSLPVATLNTVTLLGAEVHGRSYGGGILKLEPREADRIPVPRLTLVQECRDQLEAVRPHVAKALERNEVAKAVSLVDNILWSRDETASLLLDTLRQARQFLFERRYTRSRGSGNE